MISYAQNLEDVILARVFKDQATGFYVDVGANDPMVNSLTRHFYELGWHGINIEPSEHFPEWCKSRPRDINLNVAATDERKTLTFHEFPAGPSLGTVSDTITAPMQAFSDGRYDREVQGLSLREILAEHARGVIDFLSVDVEGHEREVLLGNDWNHFRPRVVVVEATEPMRPVPNHDQWEPLITSHRYEFVYFDGLNRFYLREEDSSLKPLFATPPNVFDDYTPAVVQTLRDQLTSTQHELKATQFELDRTRRDEIDNTRLVAEYRRICAGTSGGSLANTMPLARLLTRLKCWLKRSPRPNHPM